MRQALAKRPILSNEEDNQNQTEKFTTPYLWKIAINDGRIQKDISKRWDIHAGNQMSKVR